MRILLVLITVLLCSICKAQLVKEVQPEPRPILIGWDKTTVLVFPYEVLGADFGSAAVLAEKEKVAPNVLKLKAGKKNFPATNMYVITSSGRLYPFTVGFTEDPDSRPIDIAGQSSMGYSEVQLGGNLFDQVELSAVLEKKVSHFPAKISWGKKSGKTRIGIGGISEMDGLLFFQIVFENSGSMDYLPEKWEFSVHDKRQAKRTAVREQSVEPVADRVFFDVTGETTALAVFAFKCFTISEAKELVVQVFEKNGDRNPKFRVSGKKLLDAGSIDISNLKPQ